MAATSAARTGSSPKELLTQQRKKRTRPVSACENCHAKKVKCILKSDEPVCQRCSSSGAECLFRVDDLSSELRRKRFNDYGPPSKNDDGDDQRKRGSSLKASRHQSTPSRAEEPVGSRFKPDWRRNEADGGQKNGKAKATFRSFANPAKLGRPSRASISDDASRGTTSDATRYSRMTAATSSLDPMHSARHHLYDNNLRPTIVNLSNERERALDIPSTSHQYLGYYPSFVHSNGNPSGLSSEQQARQHQHQISRDVLHDASNASVDRLSVRHLLSSSPLDATSNTPGDESFSFTSNSNSNALLPPPLPHDSPANAVTRQVSFINAADASSPDTIHPAFTSKDRRRAIPMQSENDGPEKGWAQLAQQAKEPSHQSPPQFEKIALPFFRWFGATANTPGIRRIQVGVYHEKDAERAKQRGGQGSLPSVDGVAALRHANTTTSPLEQPFLPISTSSDSSRHLFDSDRPRYPRRDILIEMVGFVVKYFKASCFPWLDKEEIMAGAEAGELPAILANALCAVGAQISNHRDLLDLKSKTKGEPFSDMAKLLIVPMLSWPSIDVIEALIVLSYSEFALGADSGLWMYIGMALRMATDLGLQYESTITSMPSAKQQDRARMLFWAIVSLDRITCFGTGRSVSIREDSIDSALPELVESSDAFVFGHITRVLLKRGRIGELLNSKQRDLSLEEKGKRLQCIWHDLAHYYETLPPSLRFGVTTFRTLANAHQGAAFVYLHVLLQSIMSLLNRPSLLRRFDKDFNVSVPIKLASIANQASGTIVSILRFAEDAGEMPGMNPYIDCNPYLDQLILPAGRAFLAEKEDVRDALRRLGYASQSRPASRRGSAGKLEVQAAVKLQSNVGTADAVSGPAEVNTTGPFDGFIGKGQYAQMNLATCQHMLDRLASWWSGAEWPARALRQETAGAADDDIDSEEMDEKDGQPAPVRDVEMVLKWAKAARGKKPKTYGSKIPTIYNHNQQDQSHQDNNIANGGIASRIFSNESTTSGESPLGLGFSGQFNTTTEVDTEALINAWASQGIFTDFMQQSSRMPSQFDAFASDMQRQQIIPQHNHNDGTSPGVNLDFTTMQLEEFFRTGLEQPLLTPQQIDAVDQDSLMTAATNGAWEDLPSALLNAFAFHHSVENPPSKTT